MGHTLPSPSPPPNTTPQPFQVSPQVLELPKNNGHNVLPFFPLVPQAMFPP